MRARILIIGLVLSLPASTSLAADAAGSYALKDIGLTQCESLAKAVKDKNETLISRYEGWIGGYLTASNQHIPETFDVTPWQNNRILIAALLSHCQKHPQLPFGAAVTHLAAALHEDRLREKTDLVPIEHEGRTAYVYREALRRIQAALADLGIYNGNLDGELSESTRDALKAYQATKSLPETGLPDQATLYNLLMKKDG